MPYLSSFTIAFALTLWLSKFILRYLDPTIFLDHPTTRKIHTEPVPRFGGIAFGLVVLVAGAVLLNDFGRFGWYLLGGVALFVLGVVDDYWSLSWKIKLPLQIAVGLLIGVQFLGKIDTIRFFESGFSWPPALLLGLFLFWFVGILNSLNLIDGLDGLAGGYMLLTCFGALVLGWLNGAPEFALINSVFIGAMAGFLHFNQRPARFFMGDTGSLLLGFHVATLPLLYHKAMPPSQVLNITPFVILTSYLIIDTMRVFYLRIRAGRNPLLPDTNHLHHKMFTASRSYNGTILAIFSLLSLSAIFAILQARLQFGSPAMVLYLLFLGIFIAFPGATSNAVSLLAKFIHAVNQRKPGKTQHRYLYRLRYLPYIVLVYFAGLLLNKWQTGILHSVAPPSLLLGFGGVLLYVFFSERYDIIAEVVVIGIGIFQAILLLYGTNPDSGSRVLMGETVRYATLALISLIAVTNYIVHTRHLTAEYWSVMDLLALFVLIGLASVQSLGLGMSPLTSYELGIVYFANKLYVPRLVGKTARAGSLAALPKSS